MPLAVDYRIRLNAYIFLNFFRSIPVSPRDFITAQLRLINRESGTINQIKKNGTIRISGRFITAGETLSENITIKIMHPQAIIILI